VKKTVKGSDYIDDDEHDKNKMLLGLGCALVAIGAPIIGFFGKKVNKGEGVLLLDTQFLFLWRGRLVQYCTAHGAG
jgi:hypothetical protein